MASGPGMGVRRGLVLGGGGVLGGTWAVGALAALSERESIPAGSFDVILGTSAGSVLGALIGAGVTVEQLCQHYRGERVRTGPLAGYSWDLQAATGGSRPGLPRTLGPGSLRLVGSGLLRPGSLPATAMLAALMPPGSAGLDRIGHLVDAVTPIGEWSAHPALWVVAMDYQSGQRTVFGRPGAPAVPLASAVMASCAIPGWFAPAWTRSTSSPRWPAIRSTSPPPCSRDWSGDGGRNWPGRSSANARRSRRPVPRSTQSVRAWRTCRQWAAT